LTRTVEKSPARAEVEALRESEERLRLAAQAARFGTYDHDLATDVNLWSPETKAIAGLPQNDEPIPTEHVLELVHPADRERVRERMQASFDPRGTGEFEDEHRLVRPDGSVRWVFVKGRTTFTGAGDERRPLRAIGVVLDVTDRHRIEDTLRESEQRFAGFMEHLPGLAWIKDLDGRYVYANEAAAHAFRIPRERLYGCTDEEVFPPATAAQFRLNDNRALASVSGVQTLETLEHDDGVLHHSLVSKFPIPAADGCIRFVGGVAVDLTERMQAEGALRESEERFRLLADSSPVLIWVNGREGCEFVNRTYREFLGVGDADVRGYDWAQFVHPDDREGYLGSYSRALEQEVAFDSEFRFRRHDGEYRWMKSVGHPRFGSGGELIGYVGSTFDITERRQVEEALRETDRRKDEFLATLAHELRNPLAPLRNGLEVMKLARSNTQIVEQACTMMERQLRQMVHLIDDLLDVSRISRGKISLRKERVPLLAVVQQAVETSRPAIEQAGHELTTSVVPDPIWVEADPTRLAQVFANLLNNAAKFTERGGHVRLTIARHGDQAVVSVRDNGIGIPVHLLPTVFEMFTQVDRSLERSQGGLGVGLSLVKGLVEMHGGSVEARSDGPGTGSEFVVRLPLILAIEEAQPENAPPGKPLVPRRILVVDDNRDAANSLAMILRIMGHEVQTVHDGIAAIETAAATQPAVILLDIGMPRLNGYDVACEIRRQEWGKGVVLVALTGWGQEDDRRRSLEAGFNFHLVKPIEIAALEKLLADL
jgi:PAS domain S-box-containing protein